MEPTEKARSASSWVFSGGRKWARALPTARGGGKFNFEDRRMASGCILNRAKESKKEILAEWLGRRSDSRTGRQKQSAA